MQSCAYHLTGREYHSGGTMAFQITEIKERRRQRMYVHGFVDGVLVTVVLIMVGLTTAAVIYSKKKK